MTIPISRRPSGVILLLILGVGPGCEDGGRPKDASPIVAPDSDAGKKAIAESESLIQLRKAQESASRRRPRVVPTEG